MKHNNIVKIIILSTIASVLLIVGAVPVIWWAWDSFLQDEPWPVGHELMLLVSVLANLAIQVVLHVFMGVYGYREFKMRRETAIKRRQG